MGTSESTDPSSSNATLKTNEAYQTEGTPFMRNHSIRSAFSPPHAAAAIEIVRPNQSPGTRTSTNQVEMRITNSIKRKVALWLHAIVLATAFVTIVPGLFGQATIVKANPRVGDSPTVAPPLATDLSATLSRRAVSHAIQKVADWQLEKAMPGFDQDWTFGVLYTGFMAVPDMANGKKYRHAMLQMGNTFHWQLGPRIDHADDHVIGQTYLDLYSRHHQSAMLTPTQMQIDAVMRIPDDPKKPLWWWCDALFMAPSVFTKLSKTTGDRKYLDYMDHEWWITSNLLYSPKDHLYFRDQSFFNTHEANGESIFWLRGNGWVFAGLARVLSDMPADYPSRIRYTAQFREMAERIASLQGGDGLWKPGLLDQGDYPLSEISGSALNTYAFAYGINSGILDRDKYKPIVQRAWRGMLAHIYQDGRLGSIQPIGAAPGAFNPTSSYVYGTGAFLLAGAEVYRLAH